MNTAEKFDRVARTDRTFELARAISGSASA